MEDTLIFIDAGFLSKINHYLGGGKYLRFDIIKLSKNLAKKQGLNCKHVFYYTSPPFQHEQMSEKDKLRNIRYKKFKKRLSANNIVLIREGRCQRLKIDGKFQYKQKGVDALVIIDIMSIPIEHKDVKKVLLIANDSDFVPVIKKIKQLGIEVILYTHYSKKRGSSFSRSNELLGAVSKYIQLTKQDFVEAKLEKC